MTTSTYSRAHRGHHLDRATVRLATAGLSGAVGVAYLALAILVSEAEARPGWTIDGIFGTYVFAAVPYLATAVLGTRVDRRALWVTGAVTQVLMIVGLLWLGLQVVGPGGPPGEPTVFDHPPLSGLGMGWWAAGIATAQVALLGLHLFLSLRPPTDGTFLGERAQRHTTMGR